MGSRGLRSWEVSGRERQSTEQVRRLFARYRALAREADKVPGDETTDDSPPPRATGPGRRPSVRPRRRAGEE
jgi:hypothetical protein